MTTRELQRRPSDAACVAKARSTPAGDVEFEPGELDASVYGQVEIAWYPTRLQITALGVGHASITETYPSGEAGQDVIVEIRLASLHELPEIVPGAD